MTTAARPTFEPAKGGRGKGEGDLSALSKQYSSRDLPSHTKLKYRQTGQGTSEEVKTRDLRRELEEKERDTRVKRGREKPRSFTELPPAVNVATKKQRIDQPPTQPASIDADDPDNEDEDEEDDDSDEDDTAELLKELQKIKRERAEEAARRETERKEEEERIRTENLMRGNPLLNQERGNFKVKRRWDDDVVFKNCAKAEPNKDRGFINDTIRSDFHRKFMDKYVK